MNNKETKMPAEQPQTKEQQHTRSTKRPKQKKEKHWFWKRTRLVPIWFRVLLTLVLIMVAMAVGAMVGYSIVGEGENAFEVFDPTTWTHIFEIIYGG
jgi:hypothetical protein